MTFNVGFIGYGEVASHFARRLTENECRVFVHDVLAEQERGLARLKDRIGSTPVTLVGFEALFRHCDIVLSTVVTQAALEVAQKSAKQLRPGQYYIDLNSTSPSIKQAIANIIQPSAALFVEGAILGALGATGADTKILLGGEQAGELSDRLNSVGLNTRFFSPTLGQASTFKMLRSIFSKGIEAILIETMLAATESGVDEALWADIVHTVTHTPFEKTASNWIVSHLSACERRYFEMQQVVETLEELHVTPCVTQGTLALFKRSTDLQLSHQAGEQPVDGVSQAINVLRTALNSHR
jgi:3-hydroxyisobutyrate dehydrogenase-like beta-hydroxyacid dehydrogenase